MQKNINVYHTHIEIQPYLLGENERLERQLSIWIDAEYRFEPMAYYVLDNTLYIPRGYNVSLLEKEYKTIASYKKKFDNCISIDEFGMTAFPRDDLQIRAIDFLLSANGYISNKKYAQYALLLDTGAGKTYITVNAISKIKVKTLIITHQHKISDQWVDTFKTKTNIDMNRVYKIVAHQSKGVDEPIRQIMNDEIEADIYIVTHDTLKTYAKNHGWYAVHEFIQYMGIGLKIFDEAHLEFRNILKIDMFSNVKQTIYLTATFDRTDTSENKLFKLTFNNTIKLDATLSADSRKHIIYVPVIYSSNPNSEHMMMASNMYGFNVMGFCKYALYLDEDQTMMRHFLNVMDMIIDKGGKIMITAPRIEDTIMLKERIEKEYKGIEKKIGVINSMRTKEENADIKENADIICSTIKSLGTGSDIKGLRFLINLEPFSSKIVTYQLSGRLREYAPDKDTYFFDLIDIAFPTCERQYKTKEKYLKKKCKAIQVKRV